MTINKNKKNNRQEKVTLFLFGIVVFLAAFQMYFGGSISAEINEIGFLEKRKEALDWENRGLEERIADRTSLAKIQRLALNLGFNQGITLVDYSSENPVALKP